METLNPSTVQIVAACIFALALLHTFSTKFFHDLAHKNPRHGGVWHLLGEVEVVFGFWAMVMVLVMLALTGPQQALEYVESRNFTEPMFVFVIMVVAATRPILDLATAGVHALARLVPLPRTMAMYFVLLSFVPLLGSFITEPAAMTLGALMLRDTIFKQPVSSMLKYATLGVLFVNISIGGVLTPFAAPPVLMVAAKWNWDITYMLTHFGWRAAIAVFVNALAITLILQRELVRLKPDTETSTARVPLIVMLVHILFLAGVVITAHHPVVFMGLLLFFLGFTTAYTRHQSPLILREALLVAFFLAGLVVLGGLQQWWLQPLLMSLSADSVFFVATGLTAITDNAALTYLGSLVDGLSEEFKLALVAGAVTGGGLTLIANAPNPAGAAILKEHFPNGAIHFFWLLVAAIPPTLVAMAAFRLL
ncbi:putative Na+/H+ antiporter [Brachymonas sp. G13]|uniref:putative Na+/H+ antiporter n=1 Tax=Brachymonas wangyanguii TaxID=3130163 RepID=UPI00307FAC87